MAGPIPVWFSMSIFTSLRSWVNVPNLRTNSGWIPPATDSQPELVQLSPDVVPQWACLEALPDGTGSKYRQNHQFGERPDSCACDDEAIHCKIVRKCAPFQFCTWREHLETLGEDYAGFGSNIRRKFIARARGRSFKRNRTESVILSRMHQKRSRRNSRT